MFDLMLRLLPFVGSFRAAIGILPFICVGLVGLPGIAAGIVDLLNWHGLLTLALWTTNLFVAAVAAASYARKRLSGLRKDAVVCLMD